MQPLATLWVSPEPLAAALLCIRLWFTSVLCDHQNIQLSLTAVAWSENTEQLHSLYISLPVPFLSSLLRSLGPVFSIKLASPDVEINPYLPLSISLFLCCSIYLMLHLPCSRSGNLWFHVSVMFAEEVEVVRDNLVCCQPRFLFCQSIN